MENGTIASAYDTFALWKMAHSPYQKYSFALSNMWQKYTFALLKGIFYLSGIFLSKCLQVARSIFLSLTKVKLCCDKIY